MRYVRTIILVAVSCRDLCYASENEGFRFLNKSLILAPAIGHLKYISEGICREHNIVLKTTKLK